MTDTESEGRKTIEIWLRENVFSVTLGHVESVWRDLKFESPYVTLSINTWSNDETTQNAAQYVADRLLYLSEPGVSVDIEMQAIVLPRLSDGYRVTVKIIQSDNLAILESIFGQLENGQILQGGMETEVAGPEHDTNFALLLSVFGEATCHPPQHAPPAGSNWYKFGEFWLPIPEGFTLPNTASIDFEPSEPFLEEHLSLSILEHSNTFAFKEEPEAVKHFRTYHDEIDAVQRHDHGQTQLSWGIAHIASFILTPTLLPGDPGGEFSGDLELHTRSIGVDSMGRAIFALIRGIVPRKTCFSALIDRHKEQAISLLETARITPYPPLHF